MMKVTIANYLIGNLTNRFPISQSGIIDNDIIEVMVDGWDRNQYQVLGFNGSEKPKQSSSQRLLMQALLLRYLCRS